MATKKQVYVSSTFIDLKEHRAALKLALEKAQYDVECMEKYPAFDERPKDKCLLDVGACDFYVLLIAHRYGFEPPADNPDAKSITHLEYEHAREGEKPRLVFAVNEDHPWPPRLIDKGRARKKLDAFRKALGLEHGIAPFTTPDNLAGQVLQALRAHEEAERQRQRKAADPAPLHPAGTGYRWPAAWDFGPYMADKREVFVGRDWLFTDIAEWLAAGHPRALLIRADFGVGKSAIMAELVHRNPGAAIAAWHFCQHDTQETLRPATFVRHLAAQLKTSVPGYREAIDADTDLQERLDNALADPGSAFEAAILTPLSRLAAPAGHRLLLIDALDEALELDPDAESKSGTLVSLLAGRSGRFPAWLRILATSRNNPQVIAPLQQAFGLKEIDAESVANQDDLREYILGRCARESLASKLRGTGHSADQIAALLCEKSLGKFLYAVRALRDLENAAIAPEDLASLTPGMDSFYLDAFERRFARAGKDYAPARDVLGIVSTAREPLPAATIAQVLGLSESRVKAVHRALPDFLRLRSGALAFDHFSMAEWLTRESEDGFPRAGDYAVDVPASEAALHQWALTQVDDGTAHTSGYLLRHLASHLVDANERSRVLARLMLSDFEWLAARLRSSGVEALIADCDHLGETAEAPLLRTLWRNSAYVLRRFPDQMPAQVLGRIRSLRDAVPALVELATCTMRWLERRLEGAGPDLGLVPTTGSLRLSAALIETFEGHEYGVSALAVLPDGRIASGAGDGTVRVWDPQGRHAPQVFEGHEGWVRALAVLPDERIASGGADRTVRVWDALTGRQLALFVADAGITALLVSPEGLIVAGDAGGSVHFLRLIEPQTGRRA